MKEGKINDTEEMGQKEKMRPCLARAGKNPK
jgi:hypothetical protein